MPKRFNTAGPCFPGDHYMVDPVTRLTEVEKLIGEKLYFTLHAPRQTGKTTYLHALTRKLNAEENYIAVVASFERAGFGGISVAKANETLINSIYEASCDQLPASRRSPGPGEENYLDLKSYLRSWANSKQKPIVLLIDEIDSLMDDVLISTLRQLRDGYQSWPEHFPSSIVLVGVRDVREYKAEIRKGRPSMGTASPFNIKSDSLVLKNFSKAEVYNLLDQHTEETGQVFPDEVKDEIHRLTCGQPWLTNALARQMVSKILDDDYTRSITMDLLFQAKQQLILRRDTHLDSLVDKLKEEWVKDIVQAIVNGDNVLFNILDDDIVYVRDLGIVSQTDPLKFANPIYAEIIPRIMAGAIQSTIPDDIQQPWFVTKNNELDMKKVFTAFQEFYSENVEAWLERFTFKESAHHLLLMAFLQRLVNAGGEIVREMAVGNGRIDLLVKFHEQRVAVELKIKRGKKFLEKAKKQLDRYLDRLGLNQGYLVIFDPGKRNREKKLYMKEITYNKKQITMVGC